jgi:pimeloyl-ACP methyl ester carboxylesterase
MFAAPMRLTAITAALLALACGRAATTAREALPLSPCHLKAEGFPGSVPAKCGALAVPENRAAPAARTLKLRVAVSPALRADPRPDPVYLLAGGPGQAASEAFVPLMRAFEPLRRARDLVLLDQRGTGGSNALRCPPPGPEGDFAPLPPEALKAWAEQCLEKLDADPAHYTTAAAVEDLDAVRAALGHEKVNLYGVSYGTRMALAYLRKYPARVRSVVLDGVVPPEFTLGTAVARDAEAALELIFTRCGKDPACAKAHPDPRGALQALLAQLDGKPVKLTVAHPLAGAPTEVIFTRAALAGAVRLLAYAPETVALLPLLIEDARRANDLSRLAAQALMVRRSLEQSLANGMGLSVACAEDVPYFPPDLRAVAAPLLGDLDIAEMVHPCAVWPRGPTLEGFREPLRSDVPALLLSGEADPVTPPGNGEAVARAMPNARHLVVPGQGHGIIHRGCVPKLVAEFVKKADAKGIDAGCLEEISPLPFFLDFVGPEP